jgi:hypothetical protein
MSSPNDPKKRPDSKVAERHTQKTHPENRPDVDAQPIDRGDDSLDPKNEPKRPDPNWKQGEYTKGYENEPE